MMISPLFWISLQVGAGFADEYSEFCMTVKPKSNEMAPKKKANAQLSPCPFCGGSAESSVLTYGEFEQYEVRCNDVRCFVSVGSYMSLEAAVQKWNTRSTRRSAARKRPSLRLLAA